MSQHCDHYLDATPRRSTRVCVQSHKRAWTYWAALPHNWAELGGLGAPKGCWKAWGCRLLQEEAVLAVDLRIRCLAPDAHLPRANAEMVYEGTRSDQVEQAVPTQ